MAQNSKPAVKSDQNILQALILHQHQQATVELQRQLKDAQAQQQETQAEHDELKKKKELDDKLHKETKKELDKLKSQYDGNYAFEKKEMRRDAMKRATMAKGRSKQVQSQLRKAKKPPASKRKP